MKAITNIYIRNYLTVCLTLFLSMISLVELNAQTNCEVTKDHGQGYTTAIKSVTALGNNSYKIVLDVKSTGCTSNCKTMSRYSVQALPGTYSNVVITVLEGNFIYNNIDLGPVLPGDDPGRGPRRRPDCRRLRLDRPRRVSDPRARSKPGHDDSPRAGRGLPAGR